MLLRSLMRYKFSFFCNCLLALGQDSRLPSNICKTTNHFSVTINKAIQGIGYIHFSAKFLYELLCSAQIMPRHTGEKVVYGLKLQTSMDEI